MLLHREVSCDVLVVGSGIAGISAALEAAEMGRSVLLASSAPIFSGSSFYPGTWGLGLIGPAGDGDRQDLADTIQSVGCGMAQPALVRTFVDGMHPAIEKVRCMGVKLRRADNGTQKEYIPCFDHKHRDWNGLEFQSVREVFSRRMEELGIVTRPNCEVLELLRQNGRVCGAVAAQGGALRLLGCKALVLASGGYGGIFKHHLCTEDVAGMGQSLALKAGASLVNMEFMQMMPGYLRPAPKTIFNEKTFRFAELRQADGTPLLKNRPDVQALLELRSTHGPFSTRLPSMAVDLELFQAFLTNEEGVEVSYTEEMRRDPPEFVKTYFDWLAQVKGLTMEDHIQIGIFAHAANGGVKIDAGASTGVPGLFACGEVTGGMHGADRIGGLSTANGLVFGGKAGRSAAAACEDARDAGPEHCHFDGETGENPGEILRCLRELMFRSAMLGRTEVGLASALDGVADLAEGLHTRPTENMKAVAATRRLEGQLTTAACVLEAALLRRESRGSHHRADHPAEDPAQAKRILIKRDGVISVGYEEEYGCL